MSSACGFRRLVVSMRIEKGEEPLDADWERLSFIDDDEDGETHYDGDFFR